MLLVPNAPNLSFRWTIVQTALLRSGAADRCPYHSDGTARTEWRDRAERDSWLTQRLGSTVSTPPETSEHLLDQTSEHLLDHNTSRLRKLREARRHFWSSTGDDKGPQEVHRLALNRLEEIPDLE
jgi:hypothetical protein